MSRWFRLAVVLVILGFLWWFLLGALERETRNAEERAANMVIAQLRAALVIKGAEVMLNGEASLADQRGINPFALIGHRWSNYRGPCQAPMPEPGGWCFRAVAQGDSASEAGGWLIYNPARPITVDNRQARAGQPLAWKVATDFADRDGNGVRDQNERLTGLRLTPVLPSGEPIPAQDAPR